MQEISIQLIILIIVLILIIIVTVVIIYKFNNNQINNKNNFRENGSGWITYCSANSIGQSCMNINYADSIGKCEAVGVCVAPKCDAYNNGAYCYYDGKKLGNCENDECK